MQKSQLSTNTPHWPLDRLVPYEYNARTHSSVRLEQIANSIRHLRLHLYRPARHARSRRPEPHYRILTGRRPRPVMHKSQLSANTEHWPLDRLVPYEYNARTHSSAPLEQIANSIRQCGFTSTGRRATRTADAVLFHRRAGGGAMMDRPIYQEESPCASLPTHREDAIPRYIAGFSPTRRPDSMHHISIPGHIGHRPLTRLTSQDEEFVAPLPAPTEGAE